MKMKTYLVLTTFLMALVLSQGVNAQEALKIGSPVPELKAVTWLDKGTLSNGPLRSLRGKVVVLEFWASWCGPCVAAIPHMNKLASDYAKRGVTFLALGDESVERVQDFVKKQPIAAIVGTDPTRANWKTFGVHSIPFTVVIGSDGRLLGVTRPDKLTSEVLDKALAGQPLPLTPIEGVDSDLEWDRLIDWQDGVVPSAYVIIKPVKTLTSGSKSQPDHVVGDGIYLSNLIQIAFQTDFYHLDWRLPEELNKETYRFAAKVPKDQPEKLLPLLQNTVLAYFGLKAEWQTQNKDVLVLRRVEGSAAPKPSEATEKQMMMLRGKITLRKQPLGMLTGLLTNARAKPVLDETGLLGEYDFELAHQYNDPKVLEEELRKAGLELIPTRRDVKVLVVTKA